ncbi:hypothetical protein [Novosphingobium cyanobacteriorum]|uniref:Uncharacterized protein n=1 Tax=Novosphingobium cyanobacteriorum TaxID=3024215 RepID=A0ABT6CLH0_9SPHN|nr:hypothetical protein [Novosphingobium cyanobacteriorum]MDF8334761.1 hypothetical protein [Novosphingobium cyanobacteriorum]
MIINIAIVSLFWVVLSCNVMVAFALGQRPEKAFATMLLAASVIGLAFSPLMLAQHWIDDLNRTVDVLILFAALWLALRSDRHWPLWFAGLQALTVINDLLAWSEIGARYRFLANLSAAWALPAMVTMTCGILLDWRRLRRPMPASA